MSRLICGVDVGTSGVRAAVVRPGLRGWSLVALVEEPLGAPADGGEAPPDAVAEAVSAVAARIPAGVEVVATALPGSLVTARQMQFPRAALRQAGAAIRIELDGALPFELSEAVFDHVVTSPPGEDPARVLVAVARAAPVRELAAVLAAAGMDPASVWAGALPFRALVAPAAPVGEAICVLDIGRLSTDLAVFRDGVPEFLRSFRVGSEDLTRALAAAAGLDRARAEDLKMRIDVCPESAVGGPHAQALLAAVDAGLSPLLGPLRRTLIELRAVEPADSAPARIWLAGRGSLLHGIAPWLSTRLGLPVEPLASRIAGLPGVDPAVVPAFGRALGTALSAASARSRTVDLRKGDVRYLGDAAALRSRFRRFGATLAVLFIAWAFGAWSRCSALDGEADRQREALGRMTKEVMERATTEFDQAGRLLDKADKPVEGPLPQADVLRMLGELSRRMPSDISNSITMLDIEPGKLTINGLTRNPEEAARIPKVLAEFTECVRDVGTLSGSGSAGDYTYQIEATTRCP
ncbi:MAG: pilus assembly protein PilM [Myxococcota bacterium]|nr:pilus assembly protein PilM [Myxococcota bacterium]